MNKSHVASGVRWALYTSIARRIVTLVLFYFVAKWLSKEDLGVFREYSLILGVLSVVGSLSLDFNYIIEQRRSQTALTAMWQITFISSVIGFLLLTGFSGILGNLYKSQLLGTMLRYTSIFLMVEIIRRAVRSMATKKLQFRDLALAETYNVMFYSFATIISLAWFRSVWVYVIAFYLGNILETIYLWYLNRREIAGVLQRRIGKLKILFASLRKHESFCIQATLASIINSFSGNAPILILGAMLSPVNIGLYFFATQLLGVPVSMFTTAVNQVFFPVFTGKKDSDISSMSNRYLRLVGYLGMPLLLLYSFIIMYLVGWLFGDKWMEAVPLIPAMFLLFGTSLYVNPIGAIPFIKRKPDWELGWNALSLVLRVGAMLWGLGISFLAAVWAFSIASAVINLAFYPMAMHLIKADLRQALKNVTLSLLPVMIYGVVLYYLSGFSSGWAIGLAILCCALLLLVLDIANKGNLRKDLRLLIG